MRVRVGTSGFAYDGWKGPFYPADLPKARMLAWYAGELDAVEVNNTFYRMPSPDVLARWAEAVPEGFRFVLKAPRRITHFAKLKDVRDAVAYLWDASAPLGERRGPILFQLPPTLRADVDRLRAFLADLPEGCRAALEFRHPSWDDDAVRDALAGAEAALCVADVDDADEPVPCRTAPFGYLRLRRAGYDEAALDRWAERVRAAGWEEAWVFFKHEDAGLAPDLARRFAARF